MIGYLNLYIVSFTKLNLLRGAIYIKKALHCITTKHRRYLTLANSNKMEIDDIQVTSNERNSKMDTEEDLEEEESNMIGFNKLPIEVMEHIFLFLEPNELMKCSLVSYGWHQIVNSYRIWLQICTRKGYYEKRNLASSCSMIENPLKDYSYSDTRLSPSRWRSHFNRYRFVEKNWKEGYFVLYSLSIKPINTNESSIIEHVDNKLVIHDVLGKVIKFCEVDVALPKVRIDTIMCKNDFLVYTQDRTVVALKRSGSSYRELFQAKLENGLCRQPRLNCSRSNFVIRVTEKFILIQDPLNPCSLIFFDIKNNNCKRQVDLHRALSCQSLSCSSIEVCGDKIYLAYRSGTQAGSNIVQYNYKLDDWEPNRMTTPSKITDLYVNKNYIVARVNPDGRESYNNNNFSLLYVWSSDDGYKLIENYCTNKYIPISLTDDDFLIYSFRDEAIVKKLGGESKSYPVSHTIMNISRVWNDYLVVHDEKGVSIWNCVTGKKVVSPLRSETCIMVHVSETNISLMCDNEQLMVISFW